MTNFEKVGLFMSTFGQEVKKKSELSSEKINSLRLSLIQEELDELTKAMKENDILEKLYEDFEGKEIKENSLKEIKNMVENTIKDVSTGYVKEKNLQKMRRQVLIKQTFLKYLVSLWIWLMALTAT